MYYMLQSFNVSPKVVMFLQSLDTLFSCQCHCQCKLNSRLYNSGYTKYINPLMLDKICALPLCF